MSHHTTNVFFFVILPRWCFEPNDKKYFFWCKNVTHCLARPCIMNKICHWCLLQYMLREIFLLKWKIYLRISLFFFFPFFFPSGEENALSWHAIPRSGSSHLALALPTPPGLYLLAPIYSGCRPTLGGSVAPSGTTAMTADSYGAAIWGITRSDSTGSTWGHLGDSNSLALPVPVLAEGRVPAPRDRSRTFHMVPCKPALIQRHVMGLAQA